MAGTERQVVNTNKAPQPLGAYSQAIRVKPGELLYIAGQVGVDKDGNLPGDGGLAAQTRQTYENIARDTDRDYYLTAEQAVEYGLVDEILGAQDQSNGKAAE